MNGGLKTLKIGRGKLVGSLIMVIFLAACSSPISQTVRVNCDGTAPDGTQEGAGCWLRMATGSDSAYGFKGLNGTPDPVSDPSKMCSGGGTICRQPGSQCTSTTICTNTFSYSNNKCECQCL
jgi:hypothetical protein